MNNCKIISTFLLLLLTTGVFLQAQSNTGSSFKPLTFGVRAGSSISGFTNHCEVFTDKKTGIDVGVFAEYKLIAPVGVSIEANFVQEGAFHASSWLIYPSTELSYSSNSTVVKSSSDIKLNTIQIPVLFNLRAPGITGAVAPKLILGYSFDFIMNAIAKDNYYVVGTNYLPLTNRGTETVTSSFKSFNMGPVCGLGIDFAADKCTYMLEARYKVGISKINNLGSLNAFNQEYDFSVNTLTITLGIAF